ncbi:hypothetical protein BDZ91DRAFT_803939 [Kalaharituber pfeilii]|nr:hypothetical protein BDZ91DRAFT_803939 [Kalaharituber pfeilii]
MGGQTRKSLHSHGSPIDSIRNLFSFKASFSPSTDIRSCPYLQKNIMNFLLLFIFPAVLALPTNILSEITKQDVDFSPASLYANVSRVEIKEVIDLIEADNGPLPWHETSSGGSSVSIPDAVWTKYAIIAQRKQLQAKKDEAHYDAHMAVRAFSKRDKEHGPGVNGKRAWVWCHRSGHWGKIKDIHSFALQACSEWQDRWEDPGWQVFYTPRLDQSFRIYYYYKYHGHLQWDGSLCIRAFLAWFESEECGAPKSRGGSIDVYTMNTGSKSWGNLAVQQQLDPNAAP